MLFFILKCKHIIVIICRFYCTTIIFMKNSYKKITFYFTSIVKNLYILVVFVVQPLIYAIQIFILQHSIKSITI